MLNSISLKNYTLFSSAKLKFSPGLNVILGENGSGKSHLLKVAYSVLAVLAEEGRRPQAGKPTKAHLQGALADKLVGVMRPASLGRLARRKQGRERCEIELTLSGPRQSVAFSFATQSRSEVSINRYPRQWLDQSPVFLPPRELLTLYPNFISVYDNHYLEFEETYRDTCLLLGALALRGPRETMAKELLKPLEAALGGRVILDKNGRFYLQGQQFGTMEMPLVAEGMRKLAMLARLIATGSLLDKGWLFWDEPETNLNPRLIKVVARVIFHLCNSGIQVFVATHSLFLLREFEILSKTPEFQPVKQRYFALAVTDDGGQAQQGDGPEDVDPLILLDEDLQQSDRYLDLESQA